MNPIKAIIVDDEPEARDILENLLIDFSDIEILSKEDSVDTALISILKYKPDIVFLDIDMPNKNGFELVKELKHFNICPTVIFVTAYNQFAIEAIKHAAFDYIMKPVDIEDMQNCLARYISEKPNSDINCKIDKLLNSINSENIKFKTRTGLVYINPEEITHCLADGNYSNIYCNGNGQYQTVTINLGKLVRELPDCFSRINRSVIINRKYLKEINSKKKTCYISTSTGVVDFDIPKKYIQQLDSL